MIDLSHYELLAELFVFPSEGFHKNIDSISALIKKNYPEAEANMRGSLGYVDASVEDGKTCSNCALYTAATAGESCGGCTLLKGPINPDGYCISWAMAAA